MNTPYLLTFFEFTFVAAWPATAQRLPLTQRYWASSPGCGRDLEDLTRSVSCDGT